MSFGFGVGDILTISGLAAQVYSAYKDAPDDYKHISMEVKSLQAIVDEARKYFDNTILSNSKRQEGKEALQGCQSVLEDLNSLIEKYKSLDSANRMQIFKRVKLGTEDIMTLRARLTSNTISLSNFIRSCEFIEMETRLTDLCLRRTSSRVSLNSISSFTGSINTKKAYKKLCRDLHDIGITADIIGRKKSEILSMFRSQNIATSGQSTYDDDDDENGETHLPISTKSIPIDNETSSKANQIKPRLNWARPPMDFLIGPMMLAAATTGNIKRLMSALTYIRNIDFMDDMNETAVHKAAWEGFTDIVRLLLKKGASIKASNIYSNTPLHRAARKGHTDIAQLLLREGASTSTTNKYGNTPLHCAAFYGHTNTVRLLLREGASMEVINEYGNTPLHDAAHNGYTATVQLFLREGAFIEAVDENGSTPLHIAARNGHTDSVQLLLREGASIEALDIHNHTPLHNAACNGYADIVQLLLEKGASIEAMDTDNYTPLDLAQQNSHADTVKLLLEKGASNEATDEDNLTPSQSSFVTVPEN